MEESAFDTLLLRCCLDMGQSIWTARWSQCGRSFRILIKFLCADVAPILLKHIPRNLAGPFLATCEHLGIVPTTTYAGLALFNWTAASGNLSASVEELKNPDNLTCLLTFTGTPDEEWFYLISVAIEAAGGPAMGLIIDAMTAIEAEQRGEGDREAEVTDLLRKLGEIIEETWKLLDRIYERCAASVFYHDMRPYWAGYKGTEKLGSLPDGIVYHLDDRQEGETQTYKHDGGSAAQSSLYHLFDVGLGVQHLTGTLRNMRALMPRRHRDFLTALEERANIRPYVMQKRAEEPKKEIVEVYEAAVHALTTFRDAHIRMATRYIAKASREPSRPTTPGTPEHQSHAEDIGKEAARGTGGQPFLPFLRQSRDDTRAASVSVRQ